MKLSRTALKELKARYLDILKKCAYLNAIVVAGSLFAYSASATTLGDVIRSDGEAVFDISQNGTGTDPIIYTVTDADTETGTETDLGVIGAGNKIIQGTANTGSTIDPSDYVLDMNGFEPLDVDSGSNLTVQDLTIQNTKQVLNVDEGGVASFNNVVVSGIDEIVTNNGLVTFDGVTINDGILVNAGALTSKNSIIASLSNTGGTASLTDTAIQNTLDVTGGTVTLEGIIDGASSVGGDTAISPGATLNATNTSLQAVENAGVLDTNSSTIASVTNSNSFDSDGDTIGILTNTSNAKLTGTNVTDILTNSGTLTASGGTIESLTNTGGTADITNAQINGVVGVTGGAVTVDNTIVNAQTTVGANGSLTAQNNAILSTVENAGTLSATNSSMTELTNTSGTASLTDTAIQNTLDVTGGTVTLTGTTNPLAVGGDTAISSGATLNATNMSLQAVENAGVLDTNSSTIASVTNSNSFDSDGDTISILTNTSNAKLTGANVTDILTNSGTLTASGGTIESLSNTGGTADITNAQINGVVGVTGGSLTVDNTIVKAQTTVGTDGALTAENGSSLSSVENAGTLDVSGGTVASLSNTGGTADITNAQINGVVGVTGGTVTVDNTIVKAQTTVGAGGTLTAENNSSLSAVENAGSLAVSGGTVASLSNTGGTADITNAQINGVIGVTGGAVTVDNTIVNAKTTVGAGGTLTAENNSSLSAVENAGSLAVSGGTVASLSNTGGTADITNAQINGVVGVTGGTVTVDNTIVNAKTTVGTDGALTAENNSSLSAIENAGTLDVTGGTVASLSNTAGTADITNAQINGVVGITGGAVTMDNAIVSAKATVSSGASLITKNNTSLSAVENAGTLDVTGGTIASLTNTAKTSTLNGVQVNGSASITGGAVVASGTNIKGQTTVGVNGSLTTQNNSSLSGVENLGNVSVLDSQINGLVSNNGTMTLSGDARLSGGVSGTGVINNTGNLTLGSADNTAFTGDFNQTAGLTIADSENFFQGNNKIAGGSLELKGDSLALKTDVTGNGTVTFETINSTSTINANKITLSSEVAGNSSVSFTNGTYTLGDMGDGTATDKVEFKNAVVKLTGDYGGETYSFENSTIDLRGNGITDVQFSTDNLQLSNTDLAFDVKLSKNADGTLSMDSDTLTNLTTQGSNPTFNLDLTKVQIANNVGLDSGLTTSISKKVLDGASFNTPTNSALVSTDVYQYNVGLKDAQTIELTSIQAANGDSLKAVNQYTGNSAFYMTNLDSRYEMNSDLGLTGTGNKLIQGVIETTDTGAVVIKNTIDANNYKMFDVQNDSTNLTVKNVEITGATSVLNATAGTTIFENVVIRDTNNTTLLNGNLIDQPIITNDAGDDTIFGLVLNNVFIQDENDEIKSTGALKTTNSSLKGLENSGRFYSVDSTLTSVSNSGRLTANGGTIAQILNTGGTANLTDALISGTLDVTGGTVGLIGATTPFTVGGKTTVSTNGTLNAINTLFENVDNSGSLTTSYSTVDNLENKGSFTSNGDTIASLDNSGTANLTGSTTTTLTNSGSLTTNGGSVATLINNDGTAGLTNTAVTTLTVNKGTLTATGGTVGSLTNKVDGNVTLSDVADVDTVANEGVLTSSNSTLGTVTNSNSFTSNGDTIVSLDNSGTATLTGSATTTLTNSGSLTANGGTVTTLTNTLGTASLTDTAITIVNANGGSVSLTGTNTLAVSGKTTVSAGAELNAQNISFGTVENQGEMNLANSVHFAGTVEGTGIINNTGNLTFETADVKTFTGTFNQTAGKTVADSENFFQGTNTISGGTLETKGNTLGFNATATGTGTITFESTSTDTTLVHNANQITLSDTVDGNATISFKNGSYTLNDMGTGNSGDLVQFNNANVQLTDSEYAGETYQFDNSVLNMQDDAYTTVNMENITGTNTTLAVDIGLVSKAIDDGFEGVVAKSDTLNVTGQNAFVVSNANFKVVPTAVNNQDANKDDGTLTSYTVQVLKGNASFADSLKGSTSFNAVTNAYTYNAIISDDLQTVELKAFKTTDGNSLTHINQYAGDSNFYMVVDGASGSTYQMTSDLGATGIGNKLIQGAVEDNPSVSIIDANNHSMFEVTNANTNLTVQDLTIKNATSVLTMSNGNTLLDNVIIDTLANTSPTVVINNSSTTGEYGLVLNDVQINDVNALISNSGTMKSANSNLQGVSNSGTLLAQGGTITTLSNATNGTATLSGVTNVDTITNEGVLTSSNSTLGTVTNSNSFTSNGDTIASLDNSGTANLTGSTTTTLTNSGSLTTNAGSVGTLTNNNGTAGLTNTAVTTLTVNKGTLTATGGTVGSLTNKVDGNTTLSSVTNVDTVVNEGVLTSSNSTLGTVTNSNSLTSNGDTIASLNNSGTANLTGSTTTILTNSGSLTTNGGSVATLTNNDGTAGLTNTAVTTLTVNKGTLTATGGTVSSLTNKVDGNVTLSDVVDVDTITNEGVLTSSNSILGTVTNSNSLTSNGDTIASLNNSGTANITGADTNSIVNTGSLTATGGTIENLDNQKEATLKEGVVANIVNNKKTLNITASTLNSLDNKDTGIVNVTENSTINDAVNSGTINVDNSTLRVIENNNQIVATGDLSITDSLTGTGTLTMNGAVLKVKDGFASSNNVVSNNMQFGEGIQTIQVGDLTVKEDTNLDIRNIDVTAKDVLLEKGSTLNVGLNNLSDYGSLSGTNLISEENTQIDFDLGENFEMGLYEVLKVENISSLPTALHNDEGFDFLDMADGRYSFVSTDASKISSQYGSDENQTAAIQAIHAGRGTNELFNQTQTELIEHLQSGNGALIKKAVKALDNLGGNIAPVIQSISTSHFEGITNAVSDQFRTVSTVEGTSGGDESPNAQAWVKALYGHSKYDGKGDFKANETGFVAGIQKQITDDLTVGAGYAYGYADVAQNDRDTTVQTNTGFAFARYQPNKWFVEGVASYSRSQYEEDKSILSTKSSGTYNVDTFAVQAMAGYDFSCRDLLITPKVGMKYMSINQEAYVDSLDTHIDNNTYRYMTAMAGVDVRAPYKTIHGLYIRPTAGIMFGYDLVSDDTASINTLSNGATYVNNGEALDRFSTNVNLGVDAELGDLTTLSVEYLGSFRKSYQEHGGMMKLKQNF